MRPSKQTETETDKDKDKDKYKQSSRQVCIYVEAHNAYMHNMQKPCNRFIPRLCKWMKTETEAAGPGVPNKVTEDFS